MSLLKEFLKCTDTDSVLVFTRTKHRAERVAMQLRHAGHRVSSLQGDMPQVQRQAALDGFRSGYIKILVATDIAARGIDILSISHVINYDMPDSTDAYTHRIGRTGRNAKTGDAFTFITSEDEDMVRSIERVLHANVKRCRLSGFDYKKAAPSREAKFARPARKPQRRREQKNTAPFKASSQGPQGFGQR